MTKSSLSIALRALVVFSLMLTLGGCVVHARAPVPPPVVAAPAPRAVVVRPAPHPPRRVVVRATAPRPPTVRVNVRARVR